MTPYVFFLILIIPCMCYLPRREDDRNDRRYRCFSTRENSSDPFRSELLRPLLIERVSGTKGNIQAREHIISTFQSTNLWEIELDTFNETTPDGEVQFTNIVATLNVTSTRRLVLACHYDSKKIPHFIAATDSAVPCAVLLDSALSLQRPLAQHKQNNENYPTLQLMFLDGEEAVRDWSISDSIYGSKHLAAKMRDTNVQGQTNLNQIEAMDMFVLLDLIGHKDIEFVNFFNISTGKYYERFREIESELLNTYNDNGHIRPIFSPKVSESMVEDDHLSFQGYDVPILHLIPVPFPPVWHTVSDNEDNLDFISIKHFRNIMKIFLTRYLHLKDEFCQ